jgi:O-antigen ligase
MGVLGLLALLALGVSVVLCGRRTIARRDSPYASLALIGAACAAAFLTVATLYDELGFPHATYTFLYMAGLVSVVVGRENEVDSPQEIARERALRVRRKRPRSGERASPRRERALV